MFRSPAAIVVLAVAVSLLLAANQRSYAADESDAPRFETDVRPIFKAMCFQCHGEDDELAGGLDLRLVRLMKAGGDSGQAIGDDDAEQNLLWQRIENDEMPEGTKKLAAADKETIRRWLSAGARTLRHEPADVGAAKYTDEELGYWSFQPIAEFAVPDGIDAIVRTPIDAFIAEKLRSSSLGQSPQADPSVLLRRVTFDLTGLPPTPDELDGFLHDDSPTAYEKVVDRLLASAQFGVRWGRHWLDVAGYSETEGHLAGDVHRQHAWRYRDYVIASINADKPYDEFLREQLAGDELIAETGAAPDPENDRHVELLTATGFLQMGPDLTSKNDTLSDRNQVVAETMKIVSTAALGLTVGCAQCHDHRYDPISAEDYYSMRAVFDPAFPIHDWAKPEQRLHDMTPKSTLDEIAAIEVVAKEQEAALNERKRALASEIYERLKSELPDEHRAGVIAATEKKPDQRDATEKSLLDQFPMFNSVEQIVNRISVYDAPKDKEFFNEQTQIDQLRESGPERRMIMCVRETVDKLPDSAVFARGDPLSPKSKVGPGELFVLARHREVTLPNKRESFPTTGRRLAYARQLTDGTHPTVARVAVNRIWARHFGTGFVGTTGDFGLNGQPPSHPQLLDWLATDFVDHGWTMKRLHKMIVMSHTYRQSSRRTTDADAVDPDNRLLSRMSLRRLDAEEIRDALLLVTGLMESQLAGPSVPIATEPDGRTVIGKAVFNNGGLLEKIADVGDQKYRRSVFLSNERISPLTMLSTFDAPIMTPNCDRRTVSTVAPQSLWFLNDALILDVTDKLADRMFDQSFENPEARVRDVFRRFFACDPNDDEMRTCLAFLKSQSSRLRQYGDADWVTLVKKFDHAPDVAAHATLCQSLLSTNRFLYVE